MKPTSLQDFYEQTLSVSPDGIAVQTGHFNVFRVKDLNKLKPADAAMFYNRKSFFKIALLVGSTKVKYADTTVDVEESGLLFADPNVPYQYIDQDLEDGGYFCIFSADFLFNKKSEILPDALPIFKTEYYPVFNISSEEKKELSLIFEKMCTEINSDYPYRYDLIRAYVAELIHYGQKLLPNISRSELRNAPQRITERFFSLLEQQFSINFPDDRVQVRTPKEYAAKLCVHVNGLAFVPIVKAPVYYCTTKAFFHSCTLSLGRLLENKNVEVIEIVPPALNTDLGGKGIHDIWDSIATFIVSVFIQLKERRKGNNRWYF